jgi:hypothetical protein
MTDRYFTTDTIGGAVHATGGAGVDLSLDATRTVTLDDAPWTDAFGTDEFREYEVVIARPIDQTYRIDGEEYTFRKPADELRDAAWTFDNAPHPIEHPETGVIRSPSQVHGFHRAPYFVDDYDGDGAALVTSLYVPADDEQAIEFIEDNPAVSVGFHNTLDWDTDNDDDVDAYQRNIVGDHVASVENGRCSIEDGCGIQGTIQPLGVDDGCSPGPCSCSLHDATIRDTITYNGTKGGDLDESRIPNDDYEDHYVFDAEEKTDSSFPLVDADGNLRRENVIAAASYSDDAPDEAFLMDVLSEANGAFDDPPLDEKTLQTDSIMTDSNDDDDKNSPPAVGELTLDAIAEKNEQVADLRQTNDELSSKVDVLEDKVEDLETSLDEKATELQVYRDEERADIIEEITDLTSAWDEDDLEELSLEELEDKLQVAKDVASSTPSTPDPDEPEEPTTDGDDSTETIEDGMNVSMEYRSWE